MTTVNIKNGSLRGETIEGSFVLIKRFAKIYGNPSYQVREGKVIVELDGKEQGVQVDRMDVTYSDVELQTMSVESEDDILERITNAFTAMDIFARGAIAGHVRSLIISGAAGVGKTFTLERDLKAAEAAGEITFSKIAGTCSAIGLYSKLYECSAEGDVLLLDDVDVTSDEDIMNILKAALDTSDERHISYNKASRWLKDNNIPNEFEFKGSVIFISNKDFDRELTAGTKLSPHYNAIISRSVYLDLGVHTIPEIMIRVKQVVSQTDMLTKIVSSAEAAEIIDWIELNQHNLRSLSLRTCLHIADMVKTSKDNWKMLADMTMLRKPR